MERLHFERDFDDELEAEARASRAPAQAPPALSPAELEAIRAEGYQLGHAAGLAEGRSEAEARLSGDFEARATASLEALLPEIAELRAGRAAHHRALETDLLRLVQALAGRVLPEVFEAWSPRRVEAFCRKALQMAEGPGGLTIALPPELLDEMTHRLGPALTAGGAPLRLIADPDLAAGSARATWDQGRADYSEQALQDSLLATLSHLANPAEPDRS